MKSKFNKYIFGIVPTFSVLPIVITSCNSTTPEDKKPDNEPGSNLENTTINKQINSTVLNLSNITVDSFYNKYENDTDSLKEFIFTNKNFFLSGNLDLITNKNCFEVELLQKNQNSNNVKIKLTILKGFAFIYNEPSKTSISSNVIISNFKIPPINNNELKNPNGGQWNNLNIDKYLNIVKLFNLSSTTSISSLNNDYFKQITNSNPELSGLKISIDNKSNTTENVLFVNISGSCNNKEINTQIKISGFFKFEFSQNDSYRITNISLNLDEWFKNLKPINSNNNNNEITSITDEQWKNLYLKTFLIYINNNSNCLTFEELNKINQLTFSIKNVSIKENNIVFNSSLIFNQKRFENNNWVNIDNGVELPFDTTSKNDVQIPNKNDLLKYVVNSSVINNEEIKKIYPSTLLGQSNYWSKLNHTYFQSNIVTNPELEKINQKYFSSVNNEKLNIVILTNSVNANDFDNSLSFDVCLIDGNASLSQQFKKTFNLVGSTKDIKTNQFINESNENFVSIRLADPNENTFVKRIISILKQRKNDIDLMFTNNNQSPLNFNTTKDELIPQLLNKTLINFDNTIENNSNNWIAIKKLISPAIFNNHVFEFNTSASIKQNNDEWNYYSKLFQIKQDNAFVIEGITYLFDDSIDIKIEKTNGSTLMISFAGKTNIQFSGSQEKNYPTKFCYTLTKTFWDNFKNK